MNPFVNFVIKGSILKVFGHEKGSSVYEHYKKYKKIDKKSFIESNTIANNTNLNQSAVYVSFHFGAFFNIPIHLLREGIHLNFIASKLSTSKIEEFASIIDKWDLDFSKDNIFLGDTTTGMRQIMKSLKNNQSVFSLIDTGVGMGDIRSSGNTLIVDMFGSSMYVKTSIIQLAYKLNKPIVPVFSFWEDGEVRIILDDPIYPSENFDYKEATLFIWEKFKLLCLQTKPEQWESYHTIYKLFDIQTEKSDFFDTGTNCTYKVNKKNYECIVEKNDYYLCSYSTFNIFKCSKRTNYFLDYVSNENGMLSANEIKDLIPNDQVIQTLIENEILIKIN